MRIISQFRDYYDSIVPYDSDPKRVYLRNSSQVHLDKKDVPSFLVRMPCYCDTLFSSFSRNSILFCGKIYPHFGEYFNVEEYISYIQAIDVAIMGKRRKEELLKELYREKKETRPWRKETLNKGSWRRYLEEISPLRVDDIHRKYDSPIIQIVEAGRWYLTINPNLQQINFASKIDPFTAYQEIEMYLGNELAKQKDPNVDIPDEIRAESHGFDKWSFRTPPKKK